MSRYGPYLFEWVSGCGVEDYCKTSWMTVSLGFLLFVKCLVEEVSEFYFLEIAGGRSSPMFIVFAVISLIK